MDFRDKIQLQYKQMGVVERLILVNVLVFVVFILLEVIAFLFQVPDFVGKLHNWLVLPRALKEFILKPWTLLTYAFLHAGFWHIASNMIILYFSGRFFLTFFSPKRLLNYYFLGALAGGIFFLASYNIFPVFADGRSYTLLGASASVMAVLIGVATYSPNMAIRFFMFNIKLWWIAAFFVIKDFVMIPVENPGGHIAHLGGAALGYFYTTQLAKGRDIGLWFEGIVDTITGMFSSKPSTPFKKVYKNKTKPQGQRGPYQSKSNYPSNDEKQKKIDAILDKISKNGYDSLTKEEKDFLFNVGRD